MAGDFPLLSYTLGDQTMIYEPIEVFKEQAGLIPSLDTHDNGQSQYVLLNFDDAHDPENAGGYIRLTLENNGVYIQAFNADGDVILDQSIHCSQFK
jgi:hypothetical protein